MLKDEKGCPLPSSAYQSFGTFQGFELLHDIVLCQAAVVSVHSVPTAGLKIADETEAQLAPAILITLEFSNSCVGSLSRVETDDTGASGAAARFVLDFGLLHVAYRAEELDKILVTSRPWQLDNRSAKAQKLECA